MRGKEQTQSAVEIDSVIEGGSGKGTEAVSGRDSVVERVRGKGTEAVRCSKR